MHIQKRKPAKQTDDTSSDEESTGSNNVSENYLNFFYLYILITDNINTLKYIKDLITVDSDTSDDEDNSVSTLTHHKTLKKLQINAKIILLQ